MIGAANQIFNHHLDLSRENVNKTRELYVYIMLNILNQKTECIFAHKILLEYILLLADENSQNTKFYKQF